MRVLGNSLILPGRKCFLREGRFKEWTEIARVCAVEISELTLNPDWQ